MKIRVGELMRVVRCSGIDSGREGTVVPRSELPVDGRGIPQIGQGHYKPLAPHEIVLRDDRGRLFTMFRNRLEEVNR